MVGWMGQILQVDLTHLKINRLLTEKYAEKYLGGRGIASRIYWETVRPTIKAFDPENRLILMTGPVVGTGAQAATRMSIVSKSPMAFPEGYCYGNIGGYFGAELKMTGFILILSSSLVLILNAPLKNAKAAGSAYISLNIVWMILFIKGTETKML